MPTVFLITGTSTGFGKDYAQEVLDQGDIAVATACKPEFKNTSKKNFLGLRLDVTDKNSIEDTFEKAIKQFGRVDVVVNNAGYGLAGCFEELKDEQIRQQVEINFFGLIDVTRTALEHMRDQKPSGGVIQQITSIVYCASNGPSKASLKPEWGIKLTCIEPGGFWTEGAGCSMVFADKHPAYGHLDAKKSMGARHWKQAGDPKKAATAMYQFATMEDPPLHVVVGTNAYKGVMEKLKTYEENNKKWEKISNSINVDGFEG